MLLRNLLKAGLCASYCLLNAAAYIISEATKVRLYVFKPLSLPLPAGIDAGYAFVQQGQHLVSCCEGHMRPASRLCIGWPAVTLDHRLMH